MWNGSASLVIVNFHCFIFVVYFYILKKKNYSAISFQKIYISRLFCFNVLVLVTSSNCRAFIYTLFSGSIGYWWTYCYLFLYLDLLLLKKMLPVTPRRLYIPGKFSPNKETCLICFDIPSELRYSMKIYLWPPKRLPPVSCLARHHQRHCIIIEFWFWRTML